MILLSVGEPIAQSLAPWRIICVVLICLLLSFRIYSFIREWRETGAKQHLLVSSIGLALMIGLSLLTLGSERQGWWWISVATLLSLCMSIASFIAYYRDRATLDRD